MGNCYFWLWNVLILLCVMYLPCREILKWLECWQWKHWLTLKYHYWTIHITLLYQSEFELSIQRRTCATSLSSTRGISSDIWIAETCWIHKTPPLAQRLKHKASFYFSKTIKCNTVCGYNISPYKDHDAYIQYSLICHSGTEALACTSKAAETLHLKAQSHINNNGHTLLLA